MKIKGFTDLEKEVHKLMEGETCCPVCGWEVKIHTSFKGRAHYRNKRRTQFYLSEDKTITHNALTGIPYDWDYDKEIPEDRIENSLDWVIVGSESGNKRRPAKQRWIENIVIQCQDAKTPVFVKQIEGGVFKGVIKDIKQFPERLKIQQYPKHGAENLKRVV